MHDRAPRADDTTRPDPALYTPLRTSMQPGGRAQPRDRRGQVDGPQAGLICSRWAGNDPRISGAIVSWAVRAHCSSALAIASPRSRTARRRRTTSTAGDTR